MYSKNWLIIFTLLFIKVSTAMEKNLIVYQKQELCNLIADAQQKIAERTQELFNMVQEADRLTSLINCDSTSLLLKENYRHKLELTEQTCNNHQKLFQDYLHVYIPMLKKMLAELTSPTNNQLAHLPKPHARRIPWVNRHVLNPIHETLNKK